MLDRSVQLKQRVTESSHPKKRERGTHNAEVEGSSPSLTTKINGLRPKNLYRAFGDVPFCLRAGVDRARGENVALGRGPRDESGGPLQRSGPMGCVRRQCDC